MLNAEQTRKITELLGQISIQLEESGHKLFVKKPTAHIFIIKDKFFISLFDEGKDNIQLNLTKKPEKGLVNFFISRFVIDDFLSAEDPDNIAEFARDRVAGHLEELREDAAYSSNLKRVQCLCKDGHYLAAIVFLISAFETSMKDMFFRSNELWFFINDNSTDEKLLEKFGTRLDEKVSEEFQVTIHFGDKKWGFSREADERLEIWQNIGQKTAMFKVCKQLGILDEYLLRLYSNRLSEVGSYEILKETLSSQGTRCLINFQMIDGTGGIRWSFNKFLGIDFKEVDKDLLVIKEAAAKRHRIIHGFLDEKQITATNVKEVEASVIRVVAYVKNEVLEWSYVLP